MKLRAPLLALAVASCARGQVETTAVAPAGRLPPPARIVVTDFAITPGQVNVDTGLGATLRREASGTTPDQAAAQASQEAQQALAETLASRLSAYGLPVQRLAASAVPPPFSLLVQGQFVAIDQGNRTRRTLIGLGAGQSRVTADAQMYYLADSARPQFLQSFRGTAGSGHMPGAAATMGAGAVAQHAATSMALSAGMHAASEKYRSTEAAEATQVADALARQIGTFALQQGWITAGHN